MRTRTWLSQLVQCQILEFEITPTFFDRRSLQIWKAWFLKILIRTSFSFIRVPLHPSYQTIVYMENFPQWSGDNLRKHGLIIYSFLLFLVWQVLWVCWLYFLSGAELLMSWAGSWSIPSLKLFIFYEYIYIFLLKWYMIYISHCIILFFWRNKNGIY
jgi:hypothetical protein